MRLAVLVLFSIFYFLFSARSALAGTFYISSSLGSDSRSSTQAQSKTTPWAHAPGMKNWTGTYTPVAGDRFIFYGGDSWTVASFQWQISWSGTSSQPIYFGVDSTWFNAGVCGATWCRPIFDFQNTIVSAGCGGSTCAGVIVNANYVTVDSIEFLHFEMANATVRTQYRSDIIRGNESSTQTGDIIENCYFKDWGMEGTVTSSNSADTGGGGVENGFWGATALTFQGNVIDDQNGACGSTSPCYTGAGVNNGYRTLFNVCRYTNNCFKVQGLFQGNLIHDMEISTDFGNGGSDPGNHENPIYGEGPGYFIGSVMYNIPAGATSQFFPTGVSNPVIYTADNVFDLTGSYSQCFVDRYGTASGTVAYYHYNDTCKNANNTTYAVRATHDNGCIASITIVNLHSINDPWSGSSAPVTVTQTGGPDIVPFVNVDSGCSTAISITTSVPQSTASANAQGYALANGWQPTSGTNATVGKGTNETALCTGLLAPLCQALNYANLTLPGTTRPASGAWDAGAYQFGVPVLHPAIPPTNLMLSAH